MPVKAKARGATATHDEVLRAAQHLGNNAVVLMSNGAIVVAYDDTSLKYYKHEVFVIRSLYYDRVHGGYLPGKGGVSVPLHLRPQFIQAVAAMNPQRREWPADSR